MVEEMLAARGICLTYETVRQWAMKFGKAFSDQIRQRAPARGDKWRLDEVVISIAGEPDWLWRAVDQNGFVLDVLAQRRRDGRAAQRLMTKLLKSAVTPPLFERRSRGNLPTRQSISMARTLLGKSQRLASGRVMHCGDVDDWRPFSRAVQFAELRNWSGGPRFRSAKPLTRLAVCPQSAIARRKGRLGSGQDV